jgi:hypothetical protein
MKVLADVTQLVQSFGKIEICHVFREANRCADWIANYAHSLPIGLHYLPQPPIGLSSILLSDIVGIAIPRL